MVLLDTQQHVASLEVSLKQERSKRNIAEQALKNAGKPNTEDQMETQRQQVLRLQAEVNRYGSVIDRDQKLLSDNMRLVSALSSQGVQLIPMKGLESAAHSVAYSLVLPNSKLLLVASSLPNLPPSREYQLWLLRRTEPKILSGGVFNVDEANHALVEFAEGSLINEIEGISVTEEPAGGSTAAPTGPKVLSAVIER